MTKTKVARRASAPAQAKETTIQTSIRLSRAAHELLDRLVKKLNCNLREGEEEWTRTSIIEESLLDYYPEWKQLSVIAG